MIKRRSLVPFLLSRCSLNMSFPRIVARVLNQRLQAKLSGRTKYTKPFSQQFPSGLTRGLPLRQRIRRCLSILLQLRGSSRLLGQILNNPLCNSLRLSHAWGTGRGTGLGLLLLPLSLLSWLLLPLPTPLLHPRRNVRPHPRLIRRPTLLQMPISVPHRLPPRLQLLFRALSHCYPGLGRWFHGLWKRGYGFVL